jgi:hypothetical protein
LPGAKQPELVGDKHSYLKKVADAHLKETRKERKKNRKIKKNCPSAIKALLRLYLLTAVGGGAHTKALLTRY